MDTRIDRQGNQSRPGRIETLLPRLPGLIDLLHHHGRDPGKYILVEHLIAAKYLFLFKFTFDLWGRFLFLRESEGGSPGNPEPWEEMYYCNASSALGSQS